MWSPIDTQQVAKSNFTSEYVKLNVGGMLFHTTISTLTKFQDNMLAAMFSGRMDITIDKEGWVLIDRSGKHFEVILNFLRDGTVPLPNLNKELAELRAEANYFCISALIEMCDQALVAPINMQDIGSSISIVLAAPLQEKVIQSLTKPACILELNSEMEYTSSINIVSFDKLAYSFHKQILFIRWYSNLGSDRCHWNFYANGKIILTKKIHHTDHTVPDNELNLAIAKLLQTLVPES